MTHSPSTMGSTESPYTGSTARVISVTSLTPFPFLNLPHFVIALSQPPLPFTSLFILLLCKRNWGGKRSIIALYMIIPCLFFLERRAKRGRRKNRGRKRVQMIYWPKCLKICSAPTPAFHRDLFLSSNISIIDVFLPKKVLTFAYTSLFAASLIIDYPLP